MPVRKNIPYDQGLFYITFTCYRWIPLIELTNGYDLIYSWFDYLKSDGHRVVAFVIMPNHLHVMIYFRKSDKCINHIIGEGKRFVAYAIIQRLTRSRQQMILERLKDAVSFSEAKRSKKHAVWEGSFDWKICETWNFAMQKLVYIHNNPCSGKWKLAKEPGQYAHSSAKYYLGGQHVGYKVVDVEEILNEMQLAREDV